MNAKDRKDLGKVVNLLNDAMSLLETLKDWHQEKLDAMPENLQGSERYSDMEDDQFMLDDAYDTLENMIDELEEMVY